MCSTSSKNFWSALRRSGSENPLLRSSNPVTASGGWLEDCPPEWTARPSRTTAAIGSNSNVGFMGHSSGPEVLRTTKPRSAKFLCEVPVNWNTLLEVSDDLRHQQ